MSFKDSIMHFILFLVMEKVCTDKMYALSSHLSFKRWLKIIIRSEYICETEPPVNWLHGRSKWYVGGAPEKKVGGVKMKTHHPHDFCASVMLWLYIVWPDIWGRLFGRRPNEGGLETLLTHTIDYSASNLESARLFSIRFDFMFFST